MNEFAKSCSIQDSCMLNTGHEIIIKKEQQTNKLIGSLSDKQLDSFPFVCNFNDFTPDARRSKELNLTFLLRFSFYR